MTPRTTSPMLTHGRSPVDEQDPLGGSPPPREHPSSAAHPGDKAFPSGGDRPGARHHLSDRPHHHSARRDSRHLGGARTALTTTARTAQAAGPGPWPTCTAGQPDASPRAPTLPPTRTADPVPRPGPGSRGRPIPGSDRRTHHQLHRPGHRGPGQRGGAADPGRGPGHHQCRDAPVQRPRPDPRRAGMNPVASVGQAPRSAPAAESAHTRPADTVSTASPARTHVVASSTPSTGRTPARAPSVRPYHPIPDRTPGPNPARRSSTTYSELTRRAAGYISLAHAPASPGADDPQAQATLLAAHRDLAAALVHLGRTSPADGCAHGGDGGPSLPRALPEAAPRRTRCPPPSIPGERGGRA